jgi:hypothetical protein
MLPVFAENNWVTIHLFNSACRGIAQSWAPLVRKYSRAMACSESSAKCGAPDGGLRSILDAWGFSFFQRDRAHFLSPDLPLDREPGVFDNYWWRIALPEWPRLAASWPFDPGTPRMPLIVLPFKRVFRWRMAEAWRLMGAGPQTTCRMRTGMMIQNRTLLLGIGIGLFGVLTVLITRYVVAVLAGWRRRENDARRSLLCPLDLGRTLKKTSFGRLPRQGKAPEALPYNSVAHFWQSKAEPTV